MRHAWPLSSLILAATALPLAAQLAPDSLTAQVKRMAEVGSAFSPTFAPDGKRLAFVANWSGVPQLWTVDVDGGAPRQLTHLSDQIGDVAWSPAGDRLAFLMAPGGGMNSQVYVVAPDSGDPERLTDGGKETNGLDGWSHDGARLALNSNRRAAATVDAYVYDVRTRSMRRVADTHGVGGLTDLSRDGRWAVLNRLRNRGDNNLFLLDLTRGTEQLLTPHSGPGTFAQAQFSPDGRSIYLLSNKDRDLAALARVRLDAHGAPGPIEVIAQRPDAEVEDVTLSEDGRTAALLWNVAGRSELAFIDLQTLALSPGPTLPAEVASQPVFSRDGAFLALTVTGAAAPRDLWLVERASGVVRQLTHSPHPGVDLAPLVRPELVQWTASDGVPLSAWLYRPVAATAPGAVVLSFHGGPEGQERPAFNATYQALLARGIAVFAPNVRGSSGFGKRFVNLDNGALRTNAVRDIASCLDWLQQHGVADPKRIGIMGGSYGGYMTMAGLTEYPGRFAAGADLYGVVNFETFFAHTEPWMAAISTVEYGDPKTQGAMLRALSPLTRIDRVVAPTIVLHGANDTNVPVIEAEQVVNSLKRRGVPVEYVLFPDEGHGFRKTPNRVRSATAVVRWFDRYLNGSPMSTTSTNP